MFEATIITALTADTQLKALIDDRVRPIDAPFKSERPYLAYSITDENDPSPTHDGPSSFTVVSYDVVTVSDTYAEAAEISNHVRRILRNYRGTTNEIAVIYTRFDSKTDIEQGRAEGEDVPTYVRQQTFRAMYRDETPLDGVSSSSSSSGEEDDGSQDDEEEQQEEEEQSQEE
jgi:hypothetical protein